MMKLIQYLLVKTDDIEVGTVESFEHDDTNYAIYHLEPGFFVLKVIATVRKKLH